MIKKLYLLSLLGSVYFSGVSTLVAMEPPQSGSTRRPLPALPATFEEVENLFQQRRTANAQACAEFEKKLTGNERDEILVKLQAYLSDKNVKDPNDKEIINIVKSTLKDGRGDEIADLLSTHFVDLNGTYITHDSGRKFFVYDAQENNGVIAGFPLLFLNSHTKRGLEIRDAILADKTLNPGEKITASLILNKENTKNDRIRAIVKTQPVDSLTASFEKAEKDFQQNSTENNQVLNTITIRPLPVIPPSTANTQVLNTVAIRPLPVIPPQSIETFEEVEQALQHHRTANAMACAEFEKKLTVNERDEMAANIQNYMRGRTIKDGPTTKGFIKIVKNTLKDSRGDEIADLLSTHFVDLNGTYIAHDSGRKFFVYDAQENNEVIAGFPLLFLNSHTKRGLEICDAILADKTLNPGEKITASLILNKENAKNDVIRAIVKTQPVDTLTTSFEEVEKDLQQNSTTNTQVLNTVAIRPLPVIPPQPTASLTNVEDTVSK